jgi:hypothetical protein
VVKGLAGGGEEVALRVLRGEVAGGRGVRADEAVGEAGLVPTSDQSH